MRHAKRAAAVGNMVLIGLTLGLLPTLSLFSNSAEERDAIKQGMPVSCEPLFHCQYTFIA